MLERDIIRYTRSVLKASTELKALLGQDFEVYYRSARKKPQFNYIVTKIKRSRRNDPVSYGTFFLDVWIHDLDWELMHAATDLIEKLLDRAVLPGGKAVRLYFRDTDYDASDEAVLRGMLLFYLRGVNT